MQIFFSTMDLKSGFLQIDVDECYLEKTASTTPGGLYEFQVRPLGLCTALATFHRVMDTVLAKLKWQARLVFLDDVAALSGAFQEQFQHLMTVLEAIRKTALSLKTKKCRFRNTS